MIGKVIAIVFCVLGVSILIYLNFVTWTNGCESKHRVFGILVRDSKVYHEPYLVQWRFSWLPFNVWHNYITDAHYMDTAEFATEQEARNFIDKLYYQEKPSYRIKVEDKNCI